MSQERSSGAVGWTAFAGVMLILIGFFHALAGLSGIIKDQFYAVTPNYVLEVRRDHVGVDPPDRRHHRPVRGLQPVQRRGLGADDRRDHRWRERDRELRVDPRLPDLGDRRHRDRRRRHLGAHGARPRHHDVAPEAAGSDLLRGLAWRPRPRSSTRASRSGRHAASELRATVEPSSHAGWRPADGPSRPRLAARGAGRNA